MFQDLWVRVFPDRADNKPGLLFCASERALRDLRDFLFISWRVSVLAFVYLSPTFAMPGGRLYVLLL